MGNCRGGWVVVVNGKVVLTTVKIVNNVTAAVLLTSARSSGVPLRLRGCGHLLRSAVVVVDVGTGCHGGGRTVALGSNGGSWVVVVVGRIVLNVVKNVNDVASIALFYSGRLRCGGCRRSSNALVCIGYNWRGNCWLTVTNVSGKCFGVDDRLWVVDSHSRTGMNQVQRRSIVRR